MKEVSNFHRIQATTGFREAAQFVCKKINNLGIHAEIHSYEANENQWYLQQKMFQEWDCKEATLDLVHEKIRLADFNEEAISIIQKSYPCDYRNISRRTRFPIFGFTKSERKDCIYSYYAE